MVLARFRDNGLFLRLFLYHIASVFEIYKYSVIEE